MRTVATVKTAKPKKLKPAAVNQAIREKTGKRIAHTLKQLKELLEEVSTGNPSIPVNTLLDYIEGKIDEEAVRVVVLGEPATV